MCDETDTAEERVKGDDSTDLAGASVHRSPTEDVSDEVPSAEEGHDDHRSDREVVKDGDVDGDNDEGSAVTPNATKDTVDVDAEAPERRSEVVSMAEQPEGAAEKGRAQVERAPGEHAPHDPDETG